MDEYVFDVSATNLCGRRNLLFVPTYNSYVPALKFETLFRRLWDVPGHISFTNIMPRFSPVLEHYLGNNIRFLTHWKVIISFCITLYGTVDEIAECLKMYPHYTKQMIILNRRYDAAIDLNVDYGSTGNYVCIYNWKSLAYGGFLWWSIEFKFNGKHSELYFLTNENGYSLDAYVDQNDISPNSYNPNQTCKRFIMAKPKLENFFTELDEMRRNRHVENPVVTDTN